MIINNFDTNKKVFIIAEIGNNHEGDFKLARKMVSLASQAGADAVKFQTFDTENYISRSDQNRFKMIKSFELSQQNFISLKNYAHEKEIYFISTPLDLDSAIFLDGIVDAMKISSSDNNFFPLIKQVAIGENPIIISTGLVNLGEIKKTLNFLKTYKNNRFIENKLSFLHCVTSYPVDPGYANLNAIKTLKEKFNITIGYSDHTLGINASIASVALGARIIEKHFTINKNHSEFRDHKISADPDEFFKLVQSIREVERMLGNGEKIAQPPEKQILVSIRRSAIAKNNIKKGTILTEENITWVRPGGGINPEDTSKLIGKRLKFNILKGQKISNHHFN